MGIVIDKGIFWHFCVINCRHFQAYIADNVDIFAQENVKNLNLNHVPCQWQPCLKTPDVQHHASCMQSEVFEPADHRAYFCMQQSLTTWKHLKTNF